jgi:hypothetical protein
MVIIFISVSITIAALLAYAQINPPKEQAMLCDETDEAVILKSEGWRARTSIDLPWIVDAAEKGVLEFKERPTLECYEPLHPDKKVAANQFWWRVKVKKSGAADVSRLEQRAT